MDDVSGIFPDQNRIGTRREQYQRDFQNEIFERMPSSSAPSDAEDDSGFTDEMSEPQEGLINDILGPRFRSKFQNSGIHIHIGAVHYHREPRLQDLYGGSSYHGYTPTPPPPCPPSSNHQYASSPGPHLYQQSGSGHLRRVQLQHPQPDHFGRKYSGKFNIDAENAEDVGLQSREETENATRYIPLSQCTSTHTNTSSMECGLSKLKLTPSEQKIHGVPSHYEVNLEMTGAESVVWSGELKCVPSVPDLRPPTGELHRPQSAISINNPHCRQDMKTEAYDMQEVDYVNYNPPFTKKQAYRVASAETPVNRQSGERFGPEGWPKEDEMSEKQKPFLRTMFYSSAKRDQSSWRYGKRIWKSAMNLTDGAHNLRSRESGAMCSNFFCVAEGLHPDIEDENEKAHIKECLHVKGKSGNWVMLTLQNHPMNKFCLQVKSQDEVLSFPVILSNKCKYKIDPTRKGFKCLCKLIEFYKKSKLPSCDVNLGNPFPKSSIPPTEAEADCSDEIKMQYAGIRL